MSLDGDGFYDVPHAKTEQLKEVRDELERLIWEYRQAAHMRLSKESQDISTELWVQIEKILDEHLK